MFAFGRCDQFFFANYLLYARTTTLGTSIRARFSVRQYRHQIHIENAGIPVV